MEITPYKERIILSDRDFIDIDIKEAESGLKFSLVLIRDNKRLVGFDNHEGHEPHKHVKNKIYKYEFESIDKLIEDTKKSKIFCIS